MPNTCPQRGRNDGQSRLFDLPDHHVQGVCNGSVPLAGPMWLRGTLAHKIPASLTYYRQLLGVPGCEMRLHSETLYASLFRYDDIMLANPHMWGAPASANPVLELRRIEGSTWFDGYRRSFDAVWDTALPWEPPADLPQLTTADAQTSV